MSSVRTFWKLSGRSRLLALAVAGLWTGAASPPVAPLPTATELDFDFGSLRDGDLIFRRGKSALSRLVLGADRDAAFSHVGLAWRTAGGISVVHVAPGELPGIPDAAREEPLARFLSADRASAFAVYRVAPRNDTVAARAIAVARDYAERSVPFDAALDLDEPSRLYCTELVWRAYLEAGLDLIGGAGETLAFLGVRRPYISLSQLESSPALELVLRHPDSAPIRRAGSAADVFSESEDFNARTL